MRTARRLFVPILALSLLPLNAAASAPDLPNVVLHAPRDQVQRAGVAAVTCVTENNVDVWDAFQIGWPPVLVRTGAPLRIRFETDKQPSDVEILGPRGALPFTLKPYAPEGSVVAWDAEFAAPGRPPQRALQERNGRTYFPVVPRASWTDDEECPKGKQGEWGVSLRHRKRGR